MLQGTSSDAGKSVLATALCRIFSDQGIRVAPFKSQNMSNNSYVTADGKEIGRAQGVQAEAARTTANVYMNPILLKPRSDQTSEVVLFGKAVVTYSGKDYRHHFYEQGLRAIDESLARLSEAYEMIIIEGAGSPVEVNLNDRDLVNMKVAELADVPVVLVADIERGGVFASIVGTLELFNEKERSRVKGIIINKFRGDIDLFQKGVDWIERRTGLPVLGVIPYFFNINIEGEDSLSLPARFPPRERKPIDIAVIQLPYVSNYTDLEPFRDEEDVSVRFIRDQSEFAEPDAVIIPGTKSTIRDLAFLQKQGLDRKLVRYARNGGGIVGICGGYQMLSERLVDKIGADTGMKGHEVKGLSLLPVETVFLSDKKTVRCEGTLHPGTGLPSIKVNGFEIHYGATKRISENGQVSPFLLTTEGEEGCYLHDGKIIGTYFHHLFYNDDWRNVWLNGIRKEKGLALRQTEMRKKRDEAYDQLADHVRRHLDIDKMTAIINEREHEKHVSP